MKYTNIASYFTAIANGMKKIKEYPDEKNEISYAYAITRKEWSTLVSRQAKGANLRHEVYHPESISDSICQGLRKWHSHP